ncbi:hypothetical protein CI102_1445 [Trichoderma harzianum]|nr:hypothetical protein CI102_1445 [Trichoderma harzianum]
MREEISGWCPKMQMGTRWQWAAKMLPLNEIPGLGVETVHTRVPYFSTHVKMRLIIASFQATCRTNLPCKHVH